MSVTGNVFTRVFRIRSDDGDGATCFTIEVDGRQYVVTADHVIPDAAAGSSTSLFLKDGWQAVPIRSIRHLTPGEADIAVFSTDRQISPTMALESNTDGLTVGQDLFFIGYPEGRSTDLPDLHPTPLALVKHAVLSGWEMDSKGYLRLILDGVNNPGFSGGPVVFRPTPGADMRVAAVVSFFRFTTAIVHDREGRDTGIRAEINAGIIVANNVGHAVEAARELADGVPVKAWGDV